MAMVRPHIVLSITEQSFRSGGWGASLTDTYSRKIYCFGDSVGYTTRLALFLLSQIFPLDSTKAPAAATVFFGANDAALLGRASERQHVPLEELTENLKKIVHHLKKCSPRILIMLITPPPIDEDRHDAYARSLYGDKARELPERTNEAAGTYAKACLQVAHELGVCSINLWSKMQETKGWRKKSLRDGLHLTPVRNSVVYQEVAHVFDEAWLSAQAMPYDLPHHSAINRENPEKSFQHPKCA